MIDPQSTINNIRWFIIILLGTCLSCHSIERNKNKTTDKRPNIILFYADDLGWMDLGVQGSPYYETPNIDRLAMEGMRFSNAYANAANCAPSRASLMTGLYTPRHGIYTVLSSERGPSEKRKLIPQENTLTLDSTLLTLPQYLKQKGYATCMAGKWHLSVDSRDYGFDSNFGGCQKGHPASYFSPYENPQLSDGPDGEYLPERLSNEIVHWIDGQSENPFFVYFPFYSVHTPIQAKNGLTQKYQVKKPGQYHNHPKYAAMIESMDMAVGRVLDILERNNLSKNTLVIFTSDNGANGGTTLSRPLRGSKGMFYEGGIRVPFIAKWLGVIPAGSNQSTPVVGSDIFPTFVDLLGEDLSLYQFDGVSILPLLKEEKIQKRNLYWHFPAYLQMGKNDRAFEDAHGKPWFRTTPVSVIRKGNWKLLHYLEHDDIELYNLQKDIGERTNLAEKNAQKRMELYQDLEKWRKDVGAPVPTAINGDYIQ